MRALNTIDRPILTGEMTISGSASGGPADLDALFPVGRGDRPLATSGRVVGAAHNMSISTKPYKKVQLSDGTSIAFSTVHTDEHEVA